MSLVLVGRLRDLYRACIVYYSPVSRHIVLMCTNVINLLNRVPEHDSLTFLCYTERNVNEWERFSAFFMLHRTKCKPMHFE